MLAMPAFDLIVSLVWIGGLTMWLLVVALASWMHYRRAATFARHAARLARATAPAAAIIPLPLPQARRRTSRRAPPSTEASFDHGSASPGQA